VDKSREGQRRVCTNKEKTGVDTRIVEEGGPWSERGRAIKGGTPTGKAPRKR